MEMDRTLVIVKPDAVQRRLIGNIVARFEAKGLRLVAMKLIQMDSAMAEEFYSVHRERPFFGKLVKFMTSSPCVPMIWEAPGVIPVVRGILGKTASAEAAPGTIRGDYGMSTQTNLVHASDSSESAVREIGVIFADSEIQQPELAADDWIFSPS